MTQRAWYSAGELVGALHAERARLSSQIHNARHYANVHQARRAELGQSYARAAGDLGAALLPRLTQEDVARAAQLTGYATLANEDPVGTAAKERAWLTARMAAIQGDPRFRDRELLRHPRTGSLTRARAEVDEYRRPLRVVLETAAHPRLGRLLEVGYGTPDYSVGFWRMSYFEDWKAADEITERFPEKKFFADVRAEYLRAHDAIGPLDAEHARLDAEIRAGEALEKEHAQRARALENVESSHLARARERLVAFLIECPVEALGGRLAAAPDVELLFKLLSGVVAKIRYLDAVTTEHVGKVEREAAAQLPKIEKDLVKYSRPKWAGARFPAAPFERRFRDRTARDAKTWRRYEETYTTVYVFDRYDEARMVSDFLWWDLMTRGRYDGGYIPEVYAFRQQYPDYRYEAAPPSDHDAAASALAAEESRADEAHAGVDAS